MSGLSRTPGKRVRVNSPSGVRIPLSPPPSRSARLLADQAYIGMILKSADDFVEDSVRDELWNIA